MPFGLAATRRAVEAAAAAAGCSGPAVLRQGKDGHAFVTDGGHWILDAALDRIADAKIAGRPAFRHPGRRRARSLYRARASRHTRRACRRPRRRAVVTADGPGFRRSYVCHDRSSHCPRPRRRRWSPAWPLQCSAAGPAASAAQPSAAAIALAKRTPRAQGRHQRVRPGHRRRDRCITKDILLQINPNARQGSRTTSAQSLRAELPRRAGRAARTKSRRGYAEHFTEQELKDMLAFYKTPLGKKMIDEEPKAGEESHQARAGLDRQICRRSDRENARGNEEEGPQRILSSQRAGARRDNGQCRKRSICSSSARDRAACAPPASRPAMARA